jgi:hypothetical protein
MRKAKVKRYEIGGDVDYARNENREGRESTLDPSDREDAERGRRMTGTFGQVEYSPNFETSPVRSEYDTQSGLDYAPGMGNRKPIAVAKAPVVTKEQMQKAGFNNLRDYLNAQQGLTRRGSPETKPPVTSPPKKFSPTPIPVKEDVPTATLPKKAPKRQSMFTPKGENVPGMTRGMMKRPEGYAKGGSVGSASKRADGIAIRGKTRGKMV